MIGMQSNPYRPGDEDGRDSEHTGRVELGESKGEELRWGFAGHVAAGGKDETDSALATFRYQCSIARKTH